ncbi:MAG: glycoside hydrolase family 2 TIM barrel-domain containing protein [Bacteroidales bacterium]
MKKLILIQVLLFSIILSTYSQLPSWKPAGDRIMTVFADKVNPLAPLPEYPRPQMARPEWKNINGLWDYAIAGIDEQQPKVFQGKILVPYPVESALSGVGKNVGPDKALWYSTKVSIPSSFKGKSILLHFGAVDWHTELFVNGVNAGTHEGGYDPFTFDITSFIKGSQVTLSLKVTDPVDKGPQPRGKQVLNPHGIWYTPVTGIWQTVWIEPVPASYIASTIQVPDIRKGLLAVNAQVVNQQPGDVLRISAWEGEKKISETEVTPDATASLLVPSPKLWSPESPFLYDLKVAIVRKGKVIDEVKSYFGMRSITLEPDSKGVLRMALNGKFLFQYGPLDQGWWPDGLYTPPTEEAIVYDISKTKEMGFNMIRKHVKVEPARWYYNCDKAGVLVWQDMPSGDLGRNRWHTNPGTEGGEDKTRSDLSEGIYRKEWNAIIDNLYNFPSIVVWVPFNEAWGQFKTVEITNWTMQKDRSRLVNSASGGNFSFVGHILDMHNYPGPVMPRAEVFGGKQALVLGEFGGLGLPLENHTWVGKNNWGYVSFPNADTLLIAYRNYVNQLVPFIEKGLSAAIYTQTTDVEVEVNGLMTYDRKIMKMPAQKLSEISGKLYDTAEKVSLKK